MVGFKEEQFLVGYLLNLDFFYLSPVLLWEQIWYGNLQKHLMTYPDTSLIVRNNEFFIMYVGCNFVRTL